MQTLKNLKYNMSHQKIFMIKDLFLNRLVTSEATYEASKVDYERTKIKASFNGFVENLAKKVSSFRMDSYVLL